MKKVFLKIYDKIASFFMNLNSTEVPADIPQDYYVNNLITKIEPIINDESLSDTEKINKLKHLIDRYDFLEY